MLFVTAIGRGRSLLPDQSRGSHLTAGHTIGRIIDEHSSNLLPTVSSMNDLCGANGCQVAIALISPDDFIRLHPLDAGSSCGSASMHWNNDIGVIQERVQTAAANGRNMNNLILQA